MGWIYHQNIHNHQLYCNQGHCYHGLYLSLEQYGLMCPTNFNNNITLAGMVILVKIEERKYIPRGKVSVDQHHSHFLTLIHVIIIKFKLHVVMCGISFNII